MRKIIVIVLLILCFSFTCFAEDGYSVLTDYDGSQIIFNVSDNSDIYVAGRNFFPTSNGVVYSSNSSGIFDCPLNISSNLQLSFSCRVLRNDNHISTNDFISWTTYYSDGTTSSDRYVYYGAKKNESLLKASPSIPISFSLPLESDKILSSVQFDLFGSDDCQNLDLTFFNLSLYYGKPLQYNYYFPYRSIQSYSYPYDDVVLDSEYNLIYSSSGSKVSYVINSGVYGDERDFGFPLQLVSGWVSDFFNVVFSTWWSSALVCLPLVYALFCLILKIFNIRFGFIHYSGYKNRDYPYSYNQNYKYSYIRFRILHPLRYYQIHKESKGEKAVKKELLLQELSRRSRARSMFDSDNMLNSVRIDGKIYYNPNKVIKSYGRRNDDEEVK